ncbi:hypothetical protein DFH08DRAFT_979198 [Mycena albidolilacea]|uniref:Lectin n=1 Tax=Mycena albidolilacea TaxID=1033008 RepID=A0AAD6YXC0_9AGAR|nr:hypothetical protein DFH08DRAFT_979198 [Mycena albidolilacea]
MPLALCTVSFVQAMPFSFTNDVSCVSNNYEPGAKPLKLFNVGVKAAVFAAPAGEILCHRSDASRRQRLHGSQWIAQKATGDKYYIKNVGRNAYVGIGPNNALVACPNTNPVEFILESAAADVYKIRLAGQNLVWEGVYGGVNTQYDHVLPFSRNVNIDI